MKITKRNPYKGAGSTINIWFIPLLWYVFQKIVGMKFNDSEYIWWIAIPAFFILWLMINFKIVNKPQSINIKTL